MVAAPFTLEMMERETKAAKAKSTERTIAVHASSGNVFADLGFHDAEASLEGKFSNSNRPTNRKEALVPGANC